MPWMTQRCEIFQGRRGWWAALFATLLGGLLLVFLLPNFFPPPPASSESYVFGFNNRLCLLLFLGLVTAVAVVTWAGGLKLSVCEREASPTNDGPGKSLFFRVFAVAVVLAALFFWLTYSVGGINDSTYFLDRIHLMERGMRPFQDFEFVYGSGPLYASLWLAHLFHISAKAGYYLIWLTSALLGIFFLWISIRWIDLPASGKGRVFLLTIIFMLELISVVTLNYSAMRYTLPLFAMTGLCRIDRGSARLTRVAVVAFAGLMAMVLLKSSPEEGLAYLVAVCAYLSLRRYFSGRPFLPDVLALVAIAAGLLWMAAREGTFATMKRVAAGAFNLPVYPGPVVLLGLLSVLAVVFYVVSGDIRERSQSNVMLLGIFGIGMLPAAMGRCDTIHVVGYLLGVVICAMLLSWRWLQTWRLTTVWFGLFVLVAPLITGLWYQPPTLSKALLNHLYADGPPRGFVGKTVDRVAVKLAVAILGQKRGMEKMDALRSLEVPRSLDPHVVFPNASPIVSVPFEYLPNKLNNYQGPDIYEGFYMGTLNILTPAEAQRKLDELRMHPEMDLVVQNNSYAPSEPDAGIRVQIKELLILPWVPKPKRTASSIPPYDSFIREHYEFVVEPSPATFGYGLMRRKAGM